MQMSWQTGLSWACLVLGVVFYIGGASGLFFGNATPPLDVGLVSVTLVLVLFGVVGLMLTRRNATA